MILEGNVLLKSKVMSDSILFLCILFCLFQIFYSKRVITCIIRKTFFSK